MDIRKMNVRHFVRTREVTLGGRLWRVQNSGTLSMATETTSGRTIAFSWATGDTTGIHVRRGSTIDPFARHGAYLGIFSSVEAITDPVARVLAAEAIKVAETLETT
jgi:hypothetical protein